MADVLGAISSGVNSLRNLGASVAGKTGKAIDAIGSALGNPLPQISYFGPQGLSGALEAAGAAALTPEQRVIKVQEDPRFQPGTPENKGNPVITSVADQPSYRQPNMNLTPRDPATMTQQERQTLWEAAGHTGIAPVGYGGEGGGSGDGGRKLSGDELGGIVRDTGAEGFIDENALRAIYERYGGAADRASDIARDIENTARANAEAEYNEVRRSLGVQKEEVQTISKQQRERIGKEKEAGTQELTERQEGDVADIQKASTEFADEVTMQKEQLAKNWRELSLYTQAVMRARGVSESSFAGDKEGAILLDFNKGLRVLAKSATNALKDFSDAVIETNSFYSKEKTKLAEQARTAEQDVDNWVRQQVEAIQSQENVALNKKLADIRNAISQGNQIKIQTAQQISDKIAALDTWVVQTQVQYKTAVALAAQNKVNDAASGIKTTWDMVKFANDVLEKGGGSIVTDPKTGQSAIHGSIMNPKTNEFEEFLYPITTGFAKAYETQQVIKAGQASQAAMMPGVSEQFPGFSATATKQTTTNPILKALGF